MGIDSKKKNYENSESESELPPAEKKIKTEPASPEKSHSKSKGSSKKSNKDSDARKQGGDDPVAGTSKDGGSSSACPWKTGVP